MPRVISLLPSATELVCLVGGAEMLVGRSHECDHPPEIRDRPALTGAKNAFVSCEQMNAAVTATLATGEGLYWIDAERVKSLRPDLIVTQSLCSVCSVDLRLVEQLVADMQQQQQQPEQPEEPEQPQPEQGSAAPEVLSLNPFTLEDVLSDALAVGRALGLERRAREAVAALRRRVEAATAFVASQPPLQHPTVAFLEWVEPLFPGGHWTPQLIHMAGGRHPLNPPTRPNGGSGPSAAVWNRQLAELDPDWVIICPCGLGIQETLQQLPPLTTRAFWPRLRAVATGRVALVDGNLMFNRPGPRLVDCLEFLVGLLHGRPDLIPGGFPWRPLRAGELAEQEAAWLREHPGWADSEQQGPPGAAEGAGGGSCGAGGACGGGAAAGTAGAAAGAAARPAAEGACVASGTE